MAENMPALSCPMTAAPTVQAAQVRMIPAPSLAMAYVPMQEFENLYTPEKAFNAGTLFEGLDKPFLKGAGV